MLPDLHTGFSRGRSDGLVFPSLEEYFTVKGCFDFVEIHTVKGFSIVNEAKVSVLGGIPLLFILYKRC